MEHIVAHSRKLLEGLHKRGLNRSLKVREHTFSPTRQFSCNDYLGLSLSSEVSRAWHQGLDEWGCGSGGSPSVSGFTREHKGLENDLCQWTGFERAVLFSSGFTANLAAMEIVSLLNLNPILDKLAHASLVDGARQLSGFCRYNHQDVEHLKIRLNQKSNAAVVTESVFSMDGDLTDLSAIVMECQCNDAALVVDDAHGIGVLGTNGAGGLSHFGIAPTSCQMNIITFGKALGVQGAAILCNQTLYELLINTSRHFIYSTSLPPAMVKAVSKSVEICIHQSWRREKLSENIDYFRHVAQSVGIPITDSATAIQPVMIGCNFKAVEVERYLTEMGFGVKAIRPPTVPENTARLRITITATHEKEDIKALVQALAKGLL